MISLLFAMLSQGIGRGIPSSMSYYTQNFPRRHSKAKRRGTKGAFGNTRNSRRWEDWQRSAQQAERIAEDRRRVRLLRELGLSL